MDRSRYVRYCAGSSMLDQTRLLANLRRFCDASFASFGGFPSTRVQARQEWASAFADYLEQVQEAIVPPVVNHPALVTSRVERAFFSTLVLEPTVAATTAAQDFANAWQSAVGSVTPGGSAVDGATNTYIFISFSNVAVLAGALRSTLTALFSSPSVSSLARLDEIALAFHVASSGLMAIVTITNASGASTPGSIGVL